MASSSTSSSSSSNGSSASLESLMHAGQQSMKQFDDALTSAMGIEVKPDNASSPFAVAANLQRQFWSPIMEFWKGALGNTSAPGSGAPRRDRRFQDEAWSQSPFYQLLKKSYLMTSTQLSELVEQAQVDEKSKLQLRFYARQFIDAMSPSNFPATNPEVIRDGHPDTFREPDDRDAEPDRGSPERAYHPGRRDQRSRWVAIWQQHPDRSCSRTS